VNGSECQTAIVEIGIAPCQQCFEKLTGFIGD